MAETSIPDFTGVIDQQFLLAPLGGSKSPATYLDLFPEELYNKSLDSHLTKLLYTLLGPAGIGWLHSNFLQARLTLEEYGLGGFDLDRFYGNPLKFGRILEETYDQDPAGLVSREAWESMRAKDAAYRSRALDYISGVRAGGTPLGMKLVARSGIGHEVEIFERYRYLYDQLSDDPIGIPAIGTTSSTEEMVVIPRSELPQNEVQVLSITGNPTGGTLRLFFPVGDEASNQTQEIGPSATASAIQTFLEAVPSIGTGNVIVSGGPLPNEASIAFTGDLASRDLPKLQVINSLTSSLETIFAQVTTKVEGVTDSNQIVNIAPRDQKYLQSALSRIKPMTTLPTFEGGKTNRRHQVFNRVQSTSQLVEVVRYVIGKPGVKWPQTKSHWVREGQEIETPKGFRHTAMGYVGYHTPIGTLSYSEDALLDPDYLTQAWSDAQKRFGSDHIGSFSEYQIALFPFLKGFGGADVLDASRAIAETPEPLVITTSTLESPPVPLVNGIYPADYQGLSGVDALRTPSGRFWASQERSEGSEYLEIDLGSVKAVNVLTFETTRKPFSLSVDYDGLDMAPRRSWIPARIDPDLPSITEFGYGMDATNPWESAKVSLVSKSSGGPIFTRFLRLKFERRISSGSVFFDEVSGASSPFSCEVRNLRVQRNVN